VKILPKLNFGLEMIGFLTPLPMPSTYAMFVDMHDGMLLGISQNCYENFGIPTKFVYGFAQDGTEMNIDQLCPELIDLHASGEIANPEGNVCTFDTTLLSKNYYLAEDEESVSDDELMNENHFGSKLEIDKFSYSMDTKNRYCSAKVNVVRFCEIPYPPKLLNILLFTEVTEDTT
jgi:hypothetical protein